MHRCTTSELLDSILLETQKRLGVKMMIARTKWSVQEVHAVHSGGATASPSLLSLKVALYVCVYRCMSGHGQHADDVAAATRSVKSKRSCGGSG
jgi:hypothetical protein